MMLKEDLPIEKDEDDEEEELSNNTENENR